MRPNLEGVAKVRPHLHYDGRAAHLFHGRVELHAHLIHAQESEHFCQSVCHRMRSYLISTAIGRAQEVFDGTVTVREAAAHHAPRTSLVVERVARLARRLSK